MQGIADIFLSFFYFPGPAYPQYLLRPFCRPPTASSGAAVPIADENRRCTQRSAVFRCRTGCGNGSEVSGGRFRHDFSRKNMTDNVLQENCPPPLRTLQDKKKAGNPRRFPASRIVFGDYLLNSATDFCAAATLSPAVTFLRASIACGFISLALYAAPRMK
jgi:hypothetical protein